MPPVSILASMVVGLAAVTAAPDDSTITFTPAFFEASVPATAYDMIIRLPGFSFEGGTDARAASLMRAATSSSTVGRRSRRTIGSRTFSSGSPLLLWKRSS